MIFRIVLANLSLFNSFPYSDQSQLPSSKRRHVEESPSVLHKPRPVSEEEGHVHSGNVARYDRGEASNHPGRDTEYSQADGTQLCRYAVFLVLFYFTITLQCY